MLPLQLILLLLPHLYTVTASAATSAAFAAVRLSPPCLTVLQPEGVMLLSQHAGENGTGKTSVILQYAPLQRRSTSTLHQLSVTRPNFTSPSVEWRVHLYSQHTSISMPIDLTSTAPFYDNDSNGTTANQRWKILTEIGPGFRVGTHFLRVSLLEFPQGCQQESSECDDVRHEEMEDEEDQEQLDAGRRKQSEKPDFLRRLLCATATTMFDVRIGTKQAMLQAQTLRAATERLSKTPAPSPKPSHKSSLNTKLEQKPLRIVFISGLTNDGQSTTLFQLLPRLLSDPASFQVSLLYPKFSEEQLQLHENRVKDHALDWSLDMAFRLDNKRHLSPATDLRLFHRAQSLLLGVYNNSVGALLPYEMRGWTVSEFENAGGLAGVVKRLQSVPAGRPELMTSSDRRSLKTLIDGLHGADVVHYTHIPEEALENQLIVQSARISGARRIVCEPGRWHDDTLLKNPTTSSSASPGFMSTSSGITDVIGPSVASCVNWFSHKTKHADEYSVEVYSSPITKSTRVVPVRDETLDDHPHCHVLPIGADVEVSEIGCQQAHNNDKPVYRVPFEVLLAFNSTNHYSCLHRPKVVVAVIGRLAAIKSPGMILRAAAIVKQEMELRSMKQELKDVCSTGSALPQIVIEFWGDGPLLELLAVTLAPELGLSVRRRDAKHGDADSSVENDGNINENSDVIISFEGWVPHENIHSRLQSSVDAVLHSTFEETFCVSNVEALAAGRVLLTFGTAGVAEYLEQSDAHGVVVRPPTPASLAMALLALVDSPETAAAIGRAAENYILAAGLVRNSTISRTIHFFKSLRSSQTEK